MQTIEPLAFGTLRICHTFEAVARGKIGFHALENGSRYVLGVQKTAECPRHLVIVTVSTYGGYMQVPRRRVFQFVVDHPMRYTSLQLRGQSASLQDVA